MPNTCFWFCLKPRTCLKALRKPPEPHRSSQTPWPRPWPRPWSRLWPKLWPRLWPRPWPRPRARAWPGLYGLGLEGGGPEDLIGFLSSLASLAFFAFMVLARRARASWAPPGAESPCAKRCSSSHHFFRQSLRRHSRRGIGLGCSEVLLC